MEELFRKQPPVKPTNTASNGNATNGGSKETSQVDGTSSGKKKDAVSCAFQIINWLQKNLICFKLIRFKI